VYVFIPYNQLLCSMVDLSAWERAPYSGRETIDLRKTELPFFQERSGHVICLFIMSGSQSPREKAGWSHGKKN